MRFDEDSTLSRAPASRWPTCTSTHWHCCHRTLELCRCAASPTMAVRGRQARRDPQLMVKAQPPRVGPRHARVGHARVVRAITSQWRRTPEGLARSLYEFNASWRCPPTQLTPLTPLRMIGISRRAIRTVPPAYSYYKLTTCLQVSRGRRRCNRARGDVLAHVQSTPLPSTATLLMTEALSSNSEGL